MLHREPQCTCCQLASVSKWQAAPLHRIGALKAAGLTMNNDIQAYHQNKFQKNETVQNYTEQQTTITFLYHKNHIEFKSTFSRSRLWQLSSKDKVEKGPSFSLATSSIELQIEADIIIHPVCGRPESKSQINEEIRTWHSSRNHCITSDQCFFVQAAVVQRNTSIR